MADNNSPFAGIRCENYLLNSTVSVLNSNFDLIGHDLSRSVFGVVLNAGVVEPNTKILLFDNDFYQENQNGSSVMIDGDFSFVLEARMEFNTFEARRFENANNGDLTSNFSLVRILNGAKSNLFVSGNTFNGLTNENIPPNTFPFPVRDAIIGLDLIGSSGENNEISDNTWSLKLDFAQPIRIGLRNQSFRNVTFCSNYFGNSNTGMRFEGVNLGVKAIANEFVGGGGALVVESGFITEQGVDNGDHNGNTWLRKFANIPPQFHALCNAIDCDLSQFLVHTPQTTSNATTPVFHPENITPSTNWFIVDEDGTPLSFCASQLTGPTVALALQRISDFALNESLGAIWDAEQYLYKLLEEIPVLMSGYASFPSFHSQLSSSPIGLFYDITEDVSSAYVSQGSLNSVQSLDAQSDAMIQQLAVVDSLMDTLGVSTGLVEQKDSLIGELAQVDSLTEDVLSAYRTGYISNLQAIIPQNQQVSTSYIYEENEKKVNSIFLESMVNHGGALTDSLVSELLTVALQCFEDGGMPVFRARGMLPSCVKALYESTFDSCHQESPQAYIGKNTPLVQNAEQIRDIYPNPAKGEINIPLEKDIKGVLTIFNSLGKEVHRQPIPEYSRLIKAKFDLPSGMYYCSVRWEDGILQTGQYVVQ